MSDHAALIEELLVEAGHVAADYVRPGLFTDAAAALVAEEATREDEHRHLLEAFKRADTYEAERDRLQEALAQYADIRHWAIEREEFVYRSCIWIGPGADIRPVPYPTQIAEAALAQGPAAA